MRLRLGSWWAKAAILALAIALVTMVSQDVNKRCFANSVGSQVPNITAHAGVVLDQSSFNTLFEKNPDVKLPMASTTKIMTALLAIETMDLDTIVTVPEEAAKVLGSRVYLESGEQYTLSDMLYALMISSANDAAITIAVNVAGSVEEFVALMNQKAKELWLDDTCFENPHGLDSPGHYTTARDLASLAVVAMNNPTFRSFSMATEATIPYPVKNSVRELKTHNYLLTGYPGATGVKTGFTNKAGHCVVGSAKDSGNEVVAVVLRSEAGKQWRDISTLLNFGMEKLGSQSSALLPPQETSSNLESETEGSYEYTGAASETESVSTESQSLTTEQNMAQVLLSKWPWFAGVCIAWIVLKALSNNRRRRSKRKKRLSKRYKRLK